MAKEVIFIGLPGPTHNYGGLSNDNIASSANRGSESNPRLAALQSIALMRTLIAKGMEVALLPPQLRPNIALLQTKFPGEEDIVIPEAAAQNPELLEKASSSSAMWVANAATVAPSIDATNNRMHLTTANLYTNLHRRIEAKDTHRVLAAIFKNENYFNMHSPLPSDLRDEGAANHMRLAPHHDAKGLHIFVYGAEGNADDPSMARQLLSASQKIKELHQLPDSQAIFIRQNPDVIRQGVFHNDVIAVSNEDVLLHHEKAFACGKKDLEIIEAAYAALHSQGLKIITIAEKELSVTDAVKTYFFNSQIITKPNSKMAIITAQEVAEHPGAWALMEKIRQDRSNPIDEIITLDLRQSMRNGGGPACLRLRVMMTEAELGAAKSASQVFMYESRFQALEAWVSRHYPERMRGQDLADPAHYYRAKTALTELGNMLGLPII